MPTPYSTVYRKFQSKVQDPDLDQLFISSVEAYESYLSGFLENSIPEFINCTTDLSQRNEIEFLETLSDMETNILSQLMLVQWYEKEINNILEMRLYLSGRDFTRHAEQSNFKEKSILKDKAIERSDAMMSQYGILKYLEEKKNEL